MALYHLSSVPSTMDVARDLLYSDPLALQRWDGVLADEQTQGRGQRGRTWFARAGESLCATFFYPHKFTMPSHPPDGSLQTVAMLSLLAGVAVAESIHRASSRHWASRGPTDRPHLSLMSVSNGPTISSLTTEKPGAS